MIGVGYVEHHLENMVCNRKSYDSVTFLANGTVRTEVFVHGIR